MLRDTWLRNSMCHGLDVAGQGSRELLYRRQSGTPGVINEALKLLGSEPRSRPRNRISNGALNATRLSEVDDAESRGVRDSVGSAGGVELVEKRADMKLDGMN